jgi:hypothetical protein
MSGSNVRFVPIADIQERAVQTERPPRGGLSEIRLGAIDSRNLAVWCFRCLQLERHGKT